MSLRSLLMPFISQRLLSRERVLKRRARAETKRLARNERHEVHYFYQTDDPYSALTAQVLPALLARYNVSLKAHVVGQPPDDTAPERELLTAYSRIDAARLARYRQLNFQDPGRQPTTEAISRTTAQLVAAAQDGSFVTVAAALSGALWQSAASPVTVAPVAEVLTPSGASPVAVADHLQRAKAHRLQLGHYLGATFFYAGEWYWGIDRLYHLEHRLQALGTQRAEVVDVLFPPSLDLRQAVTLHNSPPIEFFFSFRSPYSAIVAQRVFDLGRLTGVPVHLRYVLPMVMRGLPVPQIKREYIAQDTACEAFARGLSFGRVNDPVGRPTERGLALMPLAEAQGLGQAYVLSFMRGVWAEGLDAGSDRGLRTIVERCGLSWSDAQTALKNDAWRATAAANREALFALGLWGVPSFQVGRTAVWGQDRLWAIQEALLAATATS